nr:uncharacterized protein LOC128685929 [Cherax quadricarinatus]
MWWWSAGGAVCWAAQLLLLLLLLQVTLVWVDNTAGAVIVPGSLKVAVTQVTGDGAVLTWATSSGHRKVMTSCLLHYGPLTEAMHVQTAVQPAEHRIALAHLAPHTTYYAFLSCSHATTTYTSNTVHFTPHGDPAVALEVRPPPPPPPPKPVRKPPFWSSGGGRKEGGGGQSAEDGGIVVMMSQRHMDAPRRDPHSAVPSTSVILGELTCCRHTQLCRCAVVYGLHGASTLENSCPIVLEQHGGYLYNFEELMADYNQQINAGNS